MSNILHGKTLLHGPRLAACGAALLALVFACGVLAQPPVQQGRIWAPVGDDPGLFSSFTLTWGHLDGRGSGAKLAESTGMTDDDRGSFLLGYVSPWEDGRRTTVRAWGDTDDELTGGLLVHTGDPAAFHLDVSMRRWLYWDDPTTDDPYRPAGTPFLLAGQPRLEREAFGADFGWRLDARHRISGGLSDRQNTGARASLARGLATGDYLFGAPSNLDDDTWTRKGYLQGRHLLGRTTVTWGVDVQKDGGDRMVATPNEGVATLTTADLDRRSVHLRLGASTTPSAGWLVFCAYGYAWVNSKPVESRGLAGGAQPAATLASDGTETDLRRHTGQAGFVRLAASGWRLRVLGRVSSLDQVGVSHAANDLGNSMVKDASTERNRVEESAEISLSRTRGKAAWWVRYRYRHQDEDVNTVDIREFLDGAVLQTVQSSTRLLNRHEGSVRSRLKLDRHWSLTQRLGGRHEAVDQTDHALDGQYAQGDRTWKRLRYRATLRWRPAGPLSADGGYELVRESFAQDAVDGSKTTWDADRMFVTGTWSPTPKVALMTNFAYGKEDYGIDQGPAAAFANEAVYSPVAYETETYRWSQGVILHPADRWTVEGHYERVRNRDSVANDMDRWYGRVGLVAGDNSQVSFTYRRWQYDGNLGDDFIAELYALSWNLGF